MFAPALRYYNNVC